MAALGNLVIFKRPANYPRWACGCARQPALHLTNPNALEGNAWRECWTCEQARSARRWQVVAVAVLAFAVTFAALLFSWMILGGRP